MQPQFLGYSIKLMPLSQHRGGVRQVQCQRCHQWRTYPSSEGIRFDGRPFECVRAAQWNPLIRNCESALEYIDLDGKGMVVTEDASPPTRLKRRGPKPRPSPEQSSSSSSSSSSSCSSNHGVCRVTRTSAAAAAAAFTPPPSKQKKSPIII